MVSRVCTYEGLWLRMIHELLLTHKQLGKKSVSEYKNWGWSELRFCGYRDEIKILLIKIHVLIWSTSDIIGEFICVSANFLGNKPSEQEYM